MKKFSIALLTSLMAVCSLCATGCGEKECVHDYTIVTNGNGTHTKICKFDSSHTITENCSGGNATCEQKAVCSICNSEYGTQPNHTFTGGSCSECGEPQNQGLAFFPTTAGDGYVVTRGTCTDSEITIPAVYNGLPVVAIGEQGFYEYIVEPGPSEPTGPIDPGIQDPTDPTDPGAGDQGPVDPVVPPSNSTTPSPISAHTLTKITIPDSVKVIGKEAFRDCTLLNEVVMGNGVTGISNKAFISCSSLENITLSNKLEIIGTFAFENCSNLNEIVVPDSVTAILGGAFEDCTSLTRITMGNGVTTLGAAFSNTTAEIVWGNNPTLTTIDAETFNGYKGETISIPSSVTTLKDYAFGYCSATIDWGTNPTLTTLNTHAYKGYNGESIVIPNSVTAFTNTFENFSLPVVWGDNPQITTISEGLFSLYRGKTLTIPNSVITIEAFAFSSCSFTNITLGNNVKTIAEKAFQSCYNLTNIVIPDSVEILEKYALAYCTSLEKITLGNNLVNIGYDAFSYSTGEIVWSTNPKIETIPDSAFRYFEGTKITIPSSVKVIGMSAFSVCPYISEITIPSSVTTIDSSAFSGCGSLLKLTIPKTVTSMPYGICSNSDKLTIYTDATSVLSGWINEPITKWNSGRPVVWNCEYNDIADDGYIYTIIDGLNYKLYKNNESDTTDNTASLSYQSSSLVEANIPQTISYKGENYTVTVIRSRAFAHCEKLKNITIPNTVTVIYTEAFDSCYSLAEVVLPSGLETIYSNTFRACRSLVKVVIPSSVTTIEEGSLNSAETVYCEAAEKPASWDDNWLSSVAPVVWDCKNNEVATDGRIYTFIDGIRYSLKDGVAQIERQPKTLTLDTLVIKKSVTYKGTTYSVTSITSSAFSDCTIKTVIMPKSITSVGENAFQRCSTLSKVYYEGTSYDFADAEISESSGILGMMWYYYENAADVPTGSFDRYWHYVDGVPTAWER